MIGQDAQGNGFYLILRFFMVANHVYRFKMGIQMRVRFPTFNHEKRVSG
jgi:hypothetical protein